MAFHFSLILHWNPFFQNIFLFLSRVLTVAYLMAQYTNVYSKCDSKECETITWSAEKSNVEKTVIKIEQRQLSMQAVPLAGSIL